MSLPRPQSNDPEAIRQAISAAFDMIEKGRYELVYNEITSNVSITATNEASANTVVTASSVEALGSPLVIEFFTPRATSGSTWVSFFLYQDGSSIGNWGGPVGATANSVFLARRLTPALGSHIYSVRASVDGGTGTVSAGVGGSGNFLPAFIRIKRVSAY